MLAEAAPFAPVARLTRLLGSGPRALDAADPIPQKTEREKGEGKRKERVRQTERDTHTMRE